MYLKKILFNHCVTYVDNRIKNIAKAIDNATESANSETKSSAGDKHETSRAMAHLEQEKCATQLQEAMKLKNTLQQIDPEIIDNKVSLGGLIFTDRCNYYISIGAGKIEYEGAIYFAISVVSPIAQKMMGLEIGVVFCFNNINYKILKID